MLKEDKINKRLLKVEYFNLREKICFWKIKINLKLFKADLLIYGR